MPLSFFPVIALCQHASCLTDDQIKALAQNGGAMGIAFAPRFIYPECEQATIDRFVEHILYVIDLVAIEQALPESNATVSPGLCTGC